MCFTRVRWNFFGRSAWRTGSTRRCRLLRCGSISGPAVSTRPSPCLFLPSQPADTAERAGTGRRFLGRKSQRWTTVTMQTAPLKTSGSTRPRLWRTYPSPCWRTFSCAPRAARRRTLPRRRSCTSSSSAGWSTAGRARRRSSGARRAARRCGCGRSGWWAPTARGAGRVSCAGSHPRVGAGWSGSTACTSGAPRCWSGLRGAGRCSSLPSTPPASNASSPTTSAKASGSPRSASPPACPTALAPPTGKRRRWRAARGTRRA